MSVLKLKNKTGFTIIEVVLVLAIAGLIFLMVFLGLPALQRKQRDTARKQDAAMVRAALAQYKSNNKGSFATLKSRNFGHNEINEGPLAPYLNGNISAETEKYWLSGVAVPGGTAMVIDGVDDLRVIGVLFDSECVRLDDSIGRYKAGKVMIVASLEDGAHDTSSNFGRFNYCIDL